MAMKTCKECGKEISSKAKKCPHCGAKQKGGLLKKLLIGFGIIIIIAAIVNTGGDNGDSKTSDTSDKTANKSQSNYKIGDVVKFDDSEWIVLSAKNKGKRIKSNNQFQKDAVTEGKFIIVHYKVTNLTNKEERILNSPKLIDSKGREFTDYDMQSIYIPENGKTISLESLPSSMPKKLWAVYEVPKDATGLKFQTRSMSAWGSKKLVELGF